MLARLRQHIAVAHAELKTTGADGGFAIAIRVRVNLPSRAVVAGETPEGVKAEERVELSFGPHWPRKAPTIGLRRTFPGHFAHVNPHSKGDLVPPCIVEGGNTDELLHARGLDGVVDQLAIWLARAASGSLANYGDGWEPRRREHMSGSLEFDADAVSSALGPDGGIQALPSRHFGSADFVIIEVTGKRETFNCRKAQPPYFTGATATFVARAPFVNGTPAVFDTYSADDTTCVDDMLQTCVAVGINGDALVAAIDAYLQESLAALDRDAREAWPEGFVVGVVLAVERPAPLVGSPGQTTEFLTYQLLLPAQSLNARLAKHGRVTPSMHRQPANGRLLATMAGYSGESISQRIALLGVGSLGSKMSAHLGRSGFGNQVLVDKGYFYPHNVARHALFDSGRKADQMKAALTKMGHEGAVSWDRDARLVLESDSMFDEVFPPDTALLVDTTASSAVLHCLITSASLIRRGVRVARAAFYGAGRVTVLMLEAPGRATRVDDLVAVLFAEATRNARLRAALAGAGTGLTSVFVGQNCRSMTMQMADSTLSRGAAMAALQVEKWLETELPTEAVLCIGLEDACGVGTAWQTLPVRRTVEITTPHWNLRIAADVAARIDAEARGFGRLETGGALLGAISFETRTITVAGLLDAPADSIRQEMKFVLGTNGLKEMVRSANRDSLGYLGFVGTWHSHPVGGEHSLLDITTLASLALQARGAPTVSLVWTPAQLIAQVGSASFREPARNKAASA